MKPNRLKARSEAKNLIKLCAIASPPINLTLIINHLGIGLEKISLPNMQNFDAVIDHESSIILLNTSHSYVRNRFSLAHEIGHYVMGHKNYNPVFDLNSKDPREVEANYFAAELLIPFDWIKRDIATRKGKIKDLANIYKVSEDAMGWRVYKSDVILLA